MIVDKAKKLEQSLRDMKKCAVAFSGGVDSTFLLHMAQRVLGENVLAITINAPMNSKREISEAVEFAQQMKVEHIVIDIEDMNIKEFVENDPNRCYYCKIEIFNKIKNVALKHDIDYILDGTNIDDLSDYRPGMKALEELGIVSPLKLANLTKEDIRVLSKKYNVPTWDKPSFACLASRIPYGEIITKEKLDMIENAENYIQDLGFKQFRVRCHDKIARIEIEKCQMDKMLNVEIMDKIQMKLSSLGFKYVTLDLNGYKSGSLNDVLKDII